MGNHRQDTPPPFEADVFWIDSNDGNRQYYGLADQWIAVGGDTPFDAYANATEIENADIFLAMRGAGGVNLTGAAFAKHSTSGVIMAGFGAATTDGVTDWNDITNARAGQGETLLLGSHTNGPGSGQYFHPFTFEYNLKNGSGNMTQFAIPYHGASSSQMFVRTRFSGTWEAWRQVLIDNGTGFAPITDNTRSIGTAGQRFTEVRAVNGTIQTSDETEKHWLGELTEAHLRAASRIVREVGLFQWLSSIASKAEGAARIHCGVRAQRVIQIFVEEGLEKEGDDLRHSFLCVDLLKDDKGEIIGKRYGLRADELMWMVLAAQEARLAKLEGAV